MAWALTQLGKVVIASKDLDEAEKMLKRAIKLSLEAQAVPQAIDATLELADCFVHQGKANEAMELLLPAVKHPASTDAGRLRAKELMNKIEQKAGMNAISMKKMEVILARVVN